MKRTIILRQNFLVVYTPGTDEDFETKMLPSLEEVDEFTKNMHPEDWILVKPN